MSTHSTASARERYVHSLKDMPKKSQLGTISAGKGASFSGERVYVGLSTKARGSGSKPHYHLDETFNYVLEGTLKVNMDGEEFLVPPGALLHIPPKKVHTAVATDDADVVYLVMRDRSSEATGEPTTIEVASVATK